MPWLPAWPQLCLCSCAWQAEDLQRHWLSAILHAEAGNASAACSCLATPDACALTQPGSRGAARGGLGMPRRPRTLTFSFAFASPSLGTRGGGPTVKVPIVRSQPAGSGESSVYAAVSVNC